MLTISCPQCQKRYKVESTLAGKTLKCKACGGAIAISAGTQASAAAPVASAPGAAGGQAQRRAAAPAVAPALEPDRCPACGESLAAGEFVCLSCGFVRDLAESAAETQTDARADAVAAAPASIPTGRVAAPRVSSCQASKIVAPPAGRPTGKPVKIVQAAGEPRAHLALLDQWGVTILFFAGLAAVNYPWLYFLYSYVTTPRAPLPPEEWKIVALAGLLFLVCTAVMAAGIWPLILVALKQAGSALNFELPEHSFKRLVAVAAVPMIAWGICDHLFYSSASDAILHPHTATSGHTMVISGKQPSVYEIEANLQSAA